MGCSDSGVVAEEQMGFGLGDVYVNRNIAHLVQG